MVIAYDNIIIHTAANILAAMTQVCLISVNEDNEKPEINKSLSDN